MDKLRIGVIGVCGRGSLADNWKDSSRAEVVAGADVKEENLADFKSRFGDSVFTTLDYRQMLDRKDIDAVMIASPDFMHEEHAVAALQAGKHVYLEKPMAITVEGCDHIIRTEKETGKKLMVGFNMRCMNIYRTAKDVVDRGMIGEIKAAWVRHFVWSGSHWYFHDWHATKKNCTSLMLQKGSHDIDIVHWICGSYTKRVAAFGDMDFFGGDKPNDLNCRTCDEKDTCLAETPHWEKLIQCAKRKDVDVEDNNFLLMQLESGAKAAYLECHFTPDDERNYVFIGTEGSVELSERANKVWVKTRRTNDYRELSDCTYKIKKSEGSHGGADPVITEGFLDYVIDGKAPIASPIDGRMSVATGCCGAQSMRNGGMPVDIPKLDI
ncbi:Gfo/Idh/MocA family oxidoreductase [bacterium]|nr:Gfo/Idh/MocA family oxidoreductase [bacterium]